ncbi:MAG TPA: UDP-N-acetylmuramoyl-L-alanyl-D-glutamate--2,6-diaminopimelate ligase [Actinomycetota bacterium]|nr:UDP-N-acetylmuramoyl-L-alanyl-D-glutamate--2,6-diaminopimelate ligase [Actinomycetota bacterium]
MSPVTEPRPLPELLDALPTCRVEGERAVAVSGIDYRSSEAERGSVFFAVPGARADGHDFAAEAVRRGAGVVVVERSLPLPAEVTQVIVPSVREAMGPMAAVFYGRPAERLLMVGVTGTNGKTTTTYLLDGIFREAGLTPSVIGTTGVRIDGRPMAIDRTTPEAPDLHRLLARMVDEGVRAVAMEVSSHGLDQHRVGGARFDCAVFTNLSQDHLDYHGDLQAYFEAKARLFDPSLANRAAINHDSPEGRRLVGRIPTLTYGLEPGAELRAEDVVVQSDGVRFRADGLSVRSHLRGGFSVHNCLAALAAGRQVGIPDDAAVRGIAALRGVPGRMEPVDVGQEFQVLVDYAHTPDSVENVLRAARPLTEGRVIVVLGCGGDRDRGKRPLMGEAATRLAYLTVITSDNPRSEDPLAIIGEIEPGARRGGGEFVVESDRRAAIRLALERAAPGDVVVIAGKGHETGQEFADRTIPFDDRVVAREELESLGVAR